MKSVFRGIILFFITFVIGNLLASLYFSKKEFLPKPQIFSNNKNQIKSSALPKCADPITTLSRMKIILTKERSDLIDHFVINKDISKKQRAEIEKKILDKRKEIEEIRVQIEVLKRQKEAEKQNTESNDLTIKLIYKEPCYDF